MKLFIKVALLLTLTCQTINAAETDVIENQKYCFSVVRLDKFVLDDSSPDGAGIKFFPRRDCLDYSNRCEYISVFGEYITSEEVASTNDDFVEHFMANGWIIKRKSDKRINGVIWHEYLLENKTNKKTAVIYCFESKHNIPAIGYHVVAESNNGGAINDGVEKILRSWTYSDPCK